jgi:hypothetical protein
VNAAVISTARPRSDVMSYEVSVVEAVARATLPNAWVAGFAQTHMAAGDVARRSEFQTTLKPLAPEDSITSSPIGRSTPRLVDIVLSRQYGWRGSNEKFGEDRTRLISEITDEVFNELDDRWKTA